jgi:hypothetical protein
MDELELFLDNYEDQEIDLSDDDTSDPEMDQE